MSAWLPLFALDLAVVALAALVLLIDMFFRAPPRALAAIVGVGLAGILAGSFAGECVGVAPDHVYVADAWTLFFQRVFLVAGILGTLGATDWLEQFTPRRRAEFLALLLLSLTGMMLLPGVRDWILLIVAFELMGIPLALLAAWAKHDGQSREPKLAAEAGLKLFITSAASSAVTLFGVAIVTGLTRTTAIVPVYGDGAAPLAGVGMLLALGGMSFKIGAVPFHFWVPDTYQGAPTPFVAFLSVAPKAAGLATLAVVLIAGWGAASSIWAPALAAMAAASMTAGNLFALPQQDTRRLLGFSGVAQIGYALLALLARNELGLGMALFFITTYLFANMGVFFVVHAAAESAGGHTLPVLAGLSRRSPWLGGALLVFLLSLAGIPFVAGFWAKLFVLLAAWQAGMVGLVIAGVVLAVVGLYYYLGVARSTFMADGNSDAPVRVGAPLTAAIVVCLIAVLGLGLWPGPLVEQAGAAAGAFFAQQSMGR